ncbi:succinyldiaminopimelate transaminase [Microbacterium sp. EYE_5]|uniref:succinyldiaminopimelate transaminase n=1 Tax=unclassified Microbacterium TaxID=2609290 RepID=UPI002002FADA|nr:MULTISPECIES: succinyldiaminopimelate transaminase [unclassified Microbacterium]MCK6081041.1 succinyldiaminopimelate transaminase [Microbacterium sp. EYE_382]MCK6086311.1 succinyldiaminopimelate transaminase [Microbacterium sp. EYE_384]MCK6124191.1 succinyldiaminopimelate transaminase [Microbacterium sp. EYE_80]MCK6127100.1 succinyldiaminopimelate transaminase [Microbacterium sp. EYE_79]MCK6141996.1 succinyldiaminopimelate transaminase [Microbacterium sp. EYE_39]
MSVHDLADYPWDAVAPYAERARRHPGGIVDLSVGSPVDPTPAVVADAIARATDAHAYPQTVGTPALREAIVRWYARRRGVPGLTPAHVLPTVGSKELVALLPLLLGLGAGDTVVHPRAAYPSYEVGARLVGATPLASDEPAEWPETTRLVWLNTPGNPDGRVLDVPALQAAVARARELGAVIASDECYAELGWDGPWADAAVPSALDPRVTDGDVTGILSVYSLSKQSNLAGYRAAFLAGDPRVVASLLTARKHLGLMVPGPVQAAMIAALEDDAHVEQQRLTYRRRRDTLKPAVEATGFRIDRSEGGLYLWATAGEDAWRSLDRLADLGILAGPGHFYGAHYPQHVRFSLTATDERIAEAARRLSASGDS